MIPPPGNSYTEFIDQRIRQAGVKRKVKDDAIKMVSFVMTSDKDFFDGMPTEAEHAFFTDCVNFVKKRYGEENIVSAVVHKDETTPHLHINFVPITPDNRLSAKYYFDGKLADLQTAVYGEIEFSVSISPSPQSIQLNILFWLCVRSNIISVFDNAGIPSILERGEKPK